jgi:murein DD-endopeptidase MepM/ murein hydrolase activator NlpD
MNMTASTDRHLACILIAISLLSSVAIGSAENRAATITFTHKERSLKPGEVVLLKARSTLRLRSLRVEAFDREFPAFDEGGGLNWSALIGIDLETKPGRYEIKVKGIDRDERGVIAKKIFWIAAKKFPTRSLAVDERFVNPPPDELVRIEEESKKIAAIMASVTPEKLWKGPFRIPVPGEMISAFGKRNIYNNQARSPHTGADFRGDVGTPIRAPNAGCVVLAADLYYSGNTIIIDHGFGLYSYLGHMSKFSVREGDLVETGNIIGKVGATGRVTGPHLHWSVRLAKTQVDPISLVSVLGRTRRPGAAPAVSRKKKRSA